MLVLNANDILKHALLSKNYFKVTILNIFQRVRVNHLRINGKTVPVKTHSILRINE